jgi:hypothetical protein
MYWSLCESFITCRCGDEDFQTFCLNACVQELQGPVLIDFEEQVYFCC